MSARRRTVIRVTFWLALVVALCNFYHGVNNFLHSGRLWSTLSVLSKQFPSKEVQNNLFLDEAQCTAAFPGLTKEIDIAIARGPFPLEKEPDDYTGLVQARIKDGKLYVITVEHRPNRDMLFRRDAVLNQIHRAILTSPTPLPDTVFTFSISDTPRENGWSFARSNDPNANRKDWVMPHFAFFSWPKHFIGTVDESLAKIDRIEDSMPWENKVPKAVWRGTGWFNAVGNTQLRPNLLKATKGKDWADVEVLKWETNGEKASNSIRIEDFCKYKYILYTEGITYSGRLPFHTACNSIIITPPITYMMHTTHLMKPLFSSSLPFSPSANSKTGAQPNPRWPKSYSPTQANIVFVDPEWKELDETIEWLEKNDNIAKGIAKRQREVMGRGGYLSPAAEACYWRALIRGWHQVARPVEEIWGDAYSEGPENGEGVRFETFSLTGKVQWDQKRSSRPE